MFITFTHVIKSILENWSLLNEFSTWPYNSTWYVLFIVVYCCLFLFIVVYCCLFLFIVVYCCLFLYICTGVTGAKLNDSNVNLFISRDGGVSWNMVIN